LTACVKPIFSLDFTPKRGYYCQTSSLSLTPRPTLKKRHIEK
jgi:hypothetical protein